jgi:hypothetical protein
LKLKSEKALGELFAAGVDVDSVPESISLLPTSWSSIDIYPRLSLDDNAMIITYAGKYRPFLLDPDSLVYKDTENNKQTKAGADRSNYPIPLQNTAFYFEIEILNIAELG